MGSLKITKRHHKHLNNPFPSKPRTFPLIQGTLFFNPQTVPSQKVYDIGHDFLLNWSPNNGGSLSIYHKSKPSRSIWSTVPGRAFVSAAVADTEVEESRGSFAIKERNVHLLCNHQIIDDIRVINDHHDSHLPVVLIRGRIFNVKERRKGIQTCLVQESLEVVEKKKVKYAKYWVLFDQKTKNQVGFQVRLGKPNFGQVLRLSPRSYSYRGFARKLGRIRRMRVGWRGYFSRKRAVITVSPEKEDNVVIKNVDYPDFNRICFTYLSEKSERFYGFGEQFSRMDFKGKRVPIFVQEQGIGRGDQPITFAANLVSYRAGGDESTTYAPSPFYMSSKMRSLYLEGYNYSVFDLTNDECVQIQIHGDMMEGRIVHGNSPAELIENFTETIGRPQELPEWIISGAVVGMQGGTDTLRNIWDDLQAKDTPISAFWLQDWVGQRKTVIGSQLWWNWEVDAMRYSGWRQLIKDLSAQHIKVMTYCNPCLAPMDEKTNVLRHMFEEAMKLDILIKDSKGGPYMVPNTAFDVGMLDLTHPRTASWFKQILQEMVDDGVRGWMADFGEGLPVDACLYSGEDPITAHNRYPEMWAKINMEFVEEWKSNRVGKQKEDPPEALVFFMRAGFRDSPKWASLFWEGDQMVSWQANDGIKSAVVGLLSSGLSGYAFNHSDIGGYCAVNLPFFKYQRTEELLLRWMELNAFTTVFRTHEGNKPSCNSQFYSNERTLSHFSRFAKIYKAWKFYRIQLVKEGSEKGLPICRHLFLHYPEDEYVLTLTYEQFLVGTEILVVPVLDKGKEAIKVYFPKGERSTWKHVWTGKIYSEQGSESWIEAPIGYPAIFVKNGSRVGETFLQNLREYNIL
ncbi:Alpha-glucosidase [Handroanthus impetiginosus]|uniref:Alpha-glucosidase n=1 Tax=Handroanthus impetiginosus TaxID=429701 RepID=A0A2G9HVG0_9LAMI|nr:Alpha-glucosidase [Handroanthus impetiginosus]